MSQKSQIDIHQYLKAKSIQYKYAYCLKNGHNQSLKRYTCLEKQCMNTKQICEYCFEQGNQHSKHVIIHSQLLLNIANQKLLLSRIPQQIEMIDEKIDKLKNNLDAAQLVKAMEELKQLLERVVGFHTKKEFSIFQTNSILELAYKMIAFNKNIEMIKEPLSLKIQEFEIPVETVSSFFDMVNLKAKRLSQVPNEAPKLLFFQEPEKIKQQESNESEYSHNLYTQPRKSYSQKTISRRASIGEPNSNPEGDNVRLIRTRSMDMAFEVKQKCEGEDQKQNKKKKKSAKPKQVDLSLEKIKEEKDEDQDEERKEEQKNNHYNEIKEDRCDDKEGEQREESEDSHTSRNTLKLIERSALQNLIDDYNNFDVVIDASQMQVIQKAHDGIIYNMIDLGEGSGNSIRQIATLGEDGLMKFWNPSDLKCLHTINFKTNNDIHMTSDIRDIQYLKRIKCIAAVCKKTVVIINVINYKVVKTIYVEANNLDSSDQLGMLFLVNPSQKCVLIYDMFSFQEIGKLTGAQEDITSLAYAQFGGKFYYFTGEKNGNLSKYDLDQRQHIVTKRVNRINIFYLSTVRYQGGDECIVTYSSNEYVNSSYCKFISVDTLEILVNLTFPCIDSAICYNNEIYLVRSNKDIIQIIVENGQFTKKKMTHIPSSFGKGSDIFNEGLRWVKSERVALLSQYSRTQHYSNLVLFPIV